MHRLVPFLFVLAFGPVSALHAQGGAALPCLSEPTLEDFASCVRGFMPRENEESFVVPDAAARADWRSVVGQMLGGACAGIALPPSLDAGFGVAPVTDGDNGVTYCVLWDDGDADADGRVDRGWGTVVVDPDPARNLSFDVTHPRNDTNTHRQGAAVFKGTRARTLVISGAHRRTNSVTSTCQSNYEVADAAHNTAHMLHAAVEEIEAFYSGQGVVHTAIQFHGMATTTCEGVDVFITPGRNVTPPPDDPIAVLRANFDALTPAPWNITLPGGTPTCTLVGTTNTQGRLLNGVPSADVCTTAAPDAYTGRFIHIEQKRYVREDSVYGYWTDAILGTTLGLPEDPPGGEDVTVSFQEGVGGYAGTRDTYLNGKGKKNKTRNYGANGSLRLSGSAGSLLSWDVSAVPPGSPVVSAQITVDVTDPSVDGYALYASKRAWVEQEATWAQYADGQPWAVAGADGSADRGDTALGVLAAAGTGPATVALNAAGVALVQQWIDGPASNLGFVLSDYGNGDELVFASSEAGTAADRPKLTIVYQTDGGGGNLPPTAVLGASPLSGTAPLTVAFDGSASSEPDGQIVGYAWDFGDGNGGSGATTAHTYTAPGAYTARLTVTDDGGATGTATTTIDVEPPVGSSVTVVLRDGTEGYAGTRDTWIEADAPSVNHDGGPLEAGGRPDKTVLLAWDLAPIPPGSVIESADVLVEVVNKSRQTYELFEVRRPWVEAEATWNDFAAGQAWASPGATGAADRGADVLGTLQGKQTGAKTIVLNAAGVALVQDWLDGAAPNHGVLLANATARDELHLADRTASAADRPALRVQYLPPGGAAKTAAGIPASTAFGIRAFYPNPFVGEAMLEAETDAAGVVEAAVYDVLGRRVFEERVVADGAGTVRIRVALDGQASGLYLVEVRLPRDGRRAVTTATLAR